MNPYMNYNQYVAPQPVQQLPQLLEPRIMAYPVDSAEQLSGITPMPNTIYIGVSRDGSKIYQRRMNNDGLMEIKTFARVDEQTKKTDAQEIIARLESIEKKLGASDESTNAA